MNRRTFITQISTAAAVAATLPATSPSPSASPLPPLSIGICDWSFGDACDPSMIPEAAQAGLGGIQVSVATGPDNVPLRNPAFRQKYLELGGRHGIRFPSVAAGGILNAIPLKSEPQAVVYVIDAIEAAAALGAPNVLLAFFGDADLRLRDATGAFRNVSQGPFAEYELDTDGVTRVVEALRQIAHRAEDADITLGLENTLTARQNLDIIDRVGSPAVRVYYDTGNSRAYGYDVPGEIRLLGDEMICEMHLKETLGLDDPMRGLLGGPGEEGVDFPAVAAACRDIGYSGWYVLETGGRRGRRLEDTRANVAFVRRLFERS